MPPFTLALDILEHSISQHIDLASAHNGTTGLLLAGGHSRRFGTADKARHRVEGRAMIRRAYEAVHAAAAGPVLVSVRAGQERFASLPPEGVRYVEDAAADAGPLAGLAAGLRVAEAPWVLALACDLPFVMPTALARLLEARAPQADAAVAEAPEGRLQPLCACYRRAAVLPVVEAHLRAGRLALHALLDRLAVRPVRLEAGVLRNVNRPADLRGD